MAYLSPFAILKHECTSSVTNGIADLLIIINYNIIRTMVKKVVL